MNELCLFAGAGLGIWGTKYMLGFRTICYVENDPYCQQVIQSRIRDGLFDDAPIWDEIKTFDGKPWAGLVDVVTAGFPCQPWSNAGKRLGEMDERNLWPDTFRIIREVRPQFVLLENSSKLIRANYFQTILQNLSTSGYDARWKIISAAELGAPHLRDRLWVVAYTYRNGKSGLPINEQREVSGTMVFYTHSQYDDNTGYRRCQEIGRTKKIISNSCQSGLEKWQSQSENDGKEQQTIKRGNNKSGWWDAESGLGRMADGMSDRCNRLRAIGNGQVPIVVATAWNWLTGV